MPLPLFTRAAALGFSRSHPLNPAPLPSPFALIGNSGPFLHVARGAFYKLTGAFDGEVRTGAEAEACRAAIALDPEASLAYAVHTGAPFEAGEEAIAMCGIASLGYAMKVLKGRFPRGEFAIRATGGWIARDYDAHLAALGIEATQEHPGTGAALEVYFRWCRLPGVVQNRVVAEGIGSDTIETLEAEAAHLAASAKFEAGLSPWDVDVGGADDEDCEDCEDAPAPVAPARKSKPAAREDDSMQLDLFAA